MEIGKMTQVSLEEEVYKKVRDILNKLTPHKFDTLVKQVKDLEINTEERLKRVVDLVFEKAIDLPNFSVPYASMCKQLCLLRVPCAEQEGFVNFRKLLLKKCQKEFEQVSRDELKRLEKMKLIETIKDKGEKKQPTDKFEEEERKNRRRQLGNIRFIGELFKFGMLTEMIMHECIAKLMRQSDEHTLECLCRLLITIGKELETKKDKMSVEAYNAKRAIMDGYMAEMQKIVDKRQISSRVRFMLQDVIDLRKNNWKPRRNDDNPEAIDQIHKEAEREVPKQQRLLQNMPFTNKRPPDDRKRNSGPNPTNYEQYGRGTINKTSKANYNIDPSKLQFKQSAESDTVQLGPEKRFFDWCRDRSGHVMPTLEAEKAEVLSKRYSALADYCMPAQTSYDDGQNSQGSAASSWESPHETNKSQQDQEKFKQIPSVTTDLEEIAKLHKSPNPWKPQMMKASTDDENVDNEQVYKKVRGILNKLTPQKFDTLVKQAKDLEINTEERLKRVVYLVFEKAINEPNFSVLYACMCKQLALLRVPRAEQEGFVNFRKLLLTKCQKEFDSCDQLKRLEKMELVEITTDKSKKKQLTDELEEEERKNRKRQLGNIRFIGELFKFGMLTEMIVRKCISKLMRQRDEDALECLCCLLSTIGKEMEMKKDKMSVEEYNAKIAIMNGYMLELQKVVDKRQTSSRVRFILQDVIDLRKNNWKPRRNNDNPKTIDQIRQEAEAHEKQQLLQNMPFTNKRPPDDRKRNSGRNPSNYEQDGWIMTNKTSKVNYSVNPSKLQFKSAQPDTIQLGPAKGFFNWGRGSSGPVKPTPEAEKSAVLTNRYSALADHQTPAQQSYDDRRNPQRSAASSQESSRGRNNQSPPQSLRKTLSTSKEWENALETVSRFTRPGQPEPKPVEPKVPNVTNVNGKEAAATMLKGPELSEDEIEKKTRPLMDEFLHNVDFKEAVKCITELASPTTIHHVITVAINHVLERSSQARYLLGQLLHNLVQSKLIVLEQYNKGLTSILELVDDFALDIPLISDYLAEIIEPMMEGSDIPMSFLEESLRPCSPSLTAGKLVAAILHCASKKRGTIKVGEMWKDSGLQWNSFLPPSENLTEFTKTHDVEFTISQTINKPVIPEMLSAAEINTKLNFYLKDDSQNKQIFDWIESHIGANTCEPIFIRTLVTAVFENVISRSAEKCEIDTDRLKRRMALIQPYVANKDEAELQTLYALQALMLKFNQPKGILDEIFEMLYDEEIICEETFNKWETSQDPTEQEGKDAALNSVNSFLTWLREDEDSESSA